MQLDREVYPNTQRVFLSPLTDKKLHIFNRATTKTSRTVDSCTVDYRLMTQEDFIGWLGRSFRDLMNRSFDRS